MKIEIKLTNEQETKIIMEWGSRPDNPPSVQELIILVFEEELDERSPEGIAVRKFLAKKCKGYKLTPILELSEENKEYIRNNSSSMTATEMARIIFTNPKLMTGHPETRLVIAFKSTLESSIMYKNEKVLKDFKAPRNDEQVIKLVNNVVFNAYPEKIDGTIKKCLESVLGYLQNERFSTEIESYQEANERKMFINNFIRHIYNKSDLTQQDLDIIILFSNEVIEHKRIQDQLGILRERQERLRDNPDAKTSMSLVEMVNNCTNNLSKSKKVQADLLKEINEKRSDRLKKEAANNNSLLNLFKEWKEEESRLKIIKFAEERKKILGDKIDELNSKDAFDAAIFGNTKEELLYG